MCVRVGVSVYMCVSVQVCMCVCMCESVRVCECVCARVCTPGVSAPGWRSVHTAELGQALRMAEARDRGSCREQPAQLLCVSGADTVLKRAVTWHWSHAFLEGRALLILRPLEGPHVPGYQLTCRYTQCRFSAAAGDQM